MGCGSSQSSQTARSQPATRARAYGEQSEPSTTYSSLEPRSDRDCTRSEPDGQEYGMVLLSGGGLVHQRGGQNQRHTNQGRRYGKRQRPTSPSSKASSRVLGTSTSSLPAPPCQVPKEHQDRQTVTTTSSSSSSSRAQPTYSTQPPGHILQGMVSLTMHGSFLC